MIWRSAIGLFSSACKQKQNKNFFIPSHMFFDRLNSNFLYHRREWVKILTTYYHTPRSSMVCKNIVGLSLIIQLLLLCEGIHPNPGPKCTFSDISLCHANIRSLKQRDNNGLLSKLIHIKCNFAEKFSIITLSETWLSEADKSNSYKINGYQEPFRRDREAINGPVGYSGVLAWVSNNLACKRRKDLELPNIEAMWLEIRSVNNKFFLCVTYRKPTRNDFWDIFQSNINMVREINGAKILITGDLNADPQTEEGRKLSNFVFVNNLTMHITAPTRVTPDSQTILDQFLSNMPQMIRSVYVEPPVSSNDHCTIVANLLFRKRKCHSYNRVMWDFKNANFDLYRETIDSYNWEECFHDQDINKSVESWTGKILEIAKSTIPNKDVVIRPNDKPWYNNALRKLCRKKNRSHRYAKSHNTPESWERFRQVRNEYFRQISFAKDHHEERKYMYLINERNSTKKWWSVVKEIQKTNDAYESIPPIETDGHILTDAKDKASAFNDYFLEASTLNDIGAVLPNEPVFFDDGLDFIDVSLNDVTDQLKCLDTSKSYGPDNISPVFLKEGGFTLAHCLLRLFKISFNLCKFPILWKQANVVPIHKKDKQNIRSNYRPVSLLSAVGKMFERIVFKYVYNFF